MMMESMSNDQDAAEFRVIIDFEEFRGVLKELSVDGMRWWIASDPRDAYENGSITVGHIDPGCWERLNRLYFRIPTFHASKGSAEGMFLLFDPSEITSDEPGYYFSHNRVMEDSRKDFISFFNPLRDALAARLRAQNRRQMDL